MNMVENYNDCVYSMHAFVESTICHVRSAQKHVHCSSLNLVYAAAKHPLQVLDNSLAL